MPKLYLKFNDSFEHVKLKLEGAGTFQVEEKKELVDVLCHEIVNYIKHERPSELLFNGSVNLKLIGELHNNKIEYNTITKKLFYK